MEELDSNPRWLILSLCSAHAASWQADPLAAGTEPGGPRSLLAQATQRSDPHPLTCPFWTWEALSSGVWTYRGGLGNSGFGK